tara:strand:- start:89 stop:586 length:498 start_codon:yes stop_codon:yes gene_type:complete
MADENNKWSRADAPPPPLFFNNKERDLVKQVNDELIERVIGQQIMYYPISLEHTNFHPLYEEAIEKTFLPPIRVHALVEWGGTELLETTGYGLDKTSTITVHFHHRRLTQDQDIFVQEGDFVAYDKKLYEIVRSYKPRYLFGQDGFYVEISANCIEARSGVFNTE